MLVRLKSFLLVAIAYYLLASAGLLLAIPVGFASPVFPAAGMALAVVLALGPRVLPAIILGSWAANLTFMASNGAVDPAAVAVAAGVGLGAAAQAAAGRWLVRRFLGQRWRRLETEADIIRFMVLGGPLACWISALVGVTLLVAGGLIPEGERLNACWNWFVGDTLGVLIASPLCLLYLMRHDMLWRDRRNVLVVLMLAVLLLISAAFVAVARWEQSEAQAHIAHHGDEIRNAIQQRFDQQAEALSAMRRLIEVSPEFNLGQFRYLAQLTLNDHPDISALSFNPWIPASERSAFEKKMSAQLAPKSYQITERAADRSMVRAGLRTVYVPVGFIAPLDSNWAALGYDINADPVRREAIDRALRSGLPAVTESLQLVQENARHVGVLIIQPVYHDGLGEHWGNERPIPRGFAVAVLKLDQILEMATWKLKPPELALRIVDPDVQEARREIYVPAVDGDFDEKLAWTGSLHLADRRLEITILPSHRYLLEHRPWIAWATGVLGLLVASLLQVLILQSTGRTNQIKRQVAFQTLALKRQREELANLLAEHRGLIDRLPVGVFKLRVSPGGQVDFLFVSPLWCAQLGVEESEILDNSELALRDLGGADREKLRGFFSPQGSRPQAFSWQFEIGPPGEQRIMTLQATPSLQADGAILWEGMQSDVTRLHRAEFQQRLLSSAVAQSWTSIVITDLNGKIVFVNQAFVRQTGYTLEELQGQTPRVVKSGETPLATYENLWQVILAGQTWTGELLNRKKNGELYWEWASISPVRDDQGHISHFIGIKENITERKHQQQALSEAKQAAEAANLEKSRFLATMSHEIRTPMNGILGMAQMLMLPAISDAERTNYAAVIMNSGQTLLALLNDILDLSRVEAGKLELHPVAVQPAAILQELVTLFSRPASEKGLHLAAEWHGPAEAAYALDPVRLRQMISNLLSNALKFTEQGHVHLDASELRQGEGWRELIFSVTDSGIGISAEQQTRLFQPFSQVDASATRKYGGSGLGLSIVRKMAEAMAGLVGVESTPGQGARFWFTVRSYVHEGGAPAQSARLPAVDLVTVADTNLPILVVEDDRVNQAVICRMLDKLGLASVSVGDGLAACERIEQGERFRAVLMDCQMPVLDGYQATLRLRQWEKAHDRPRLPVIAVSANAYEQDQQHCLGVGMDDFVPKPIDLSRLRRVLARWLDRSLNELEDVPAEKSGLRPVDRERVQAAVQQLQRLLADNQFDAVQQLQVVQQCLDGTAEAGALSAVASALGHLDFATAEQALRRVASEQQWEIGS